MKNPIFDRRHITEYLTYGFIAALLYMIPVIFLLRSRNYENFYYLYIGTGLFMCVIFYYAFRLLYRPYDKKRAVTMLVAGNLATIAGIIISLIFVVIATWIFYPNLFSAPASSEVLLNAPPQNEPNLPSGFLVMIMMATIVANFGVGTAISVVTAYAGKRNQTKDQPAELTTHVSPEQT